MRKSALEMAALNGLVGVRSVLSTYDRAVLLGFVFSLLPVLPVALCGVLLGAMNYLLWRRGKLEVFEGGLIKKGLLLGLINLCLSVFLLKLLLGVLVEVPWQIYANWLNEKLNGVFYWLYQLRTTKGVTAL